MSIYLHELRGEVSQGDIFDSLPIAYIRQNSVYHCQIDHLRSILLTYDCEYDKPSTQFVTIAAIFPLTEVPGDRQGNVRKNKVFSTFYLESDLSFQEAFVDFRYLGRLEKKIVTEQAQNGRRLLSLANDAQLALQEQLSAFFGYGRGR
jgi:hypothetical protein